MPSLYQIPAKRGSQEDIRTPTIHHSPPTDQQFTIDDEDSLNSPRTLELKKNFAQPEDSDLSTSKPLPSDLSQCTTPVGTVAVPSVPKRHVTLATANSNMADWFTHGHFTLQREPKSNPYAKEMPLSPGPPAEFVSQLVKADDMPRSGGTGFGVGNDADAR